MAKAKKEDMIVGEAKVTESKIVVVNGEEKIQYTLDGEIRQFSL